MDERFSANEPLYSVPLFETLLGALRNDGAEPAANKAIGIIQYGVTAPCGRMHVTLNVLSSGVNMYTVSRYRRITDRDLISRLGTCVLDYNYRKSDAQTGFFSLDTRDGELRFESYLPIGDALPDEETILTFLKCPMREFMFLHLMNAPLLREAAGEAAGIGEPDEDEEERDLGSLVRELGTLLDRLLEEDEEEASDEAEASDTETDCTDIIDVDPVPSKEETPPAPPFPSYPFLHE